VVYNFLNRSHKECFFHVYKVKEGLQTMRTLGENMAWLRSSIEDC
jgi:hypothetical protein